MKSFTIGPLLVLAMISHLFSIAVTTAHWITDHHTIYHTTSEVTNDTLVRFMDGQQEQQDGGVEWTEYRIRGVNWFGFNTQCLTVHGLWAHDLHFYLDCLNTYQINSLRIPFSYEMVGHYYFLEEQCFSIPVARHLWKSNRHADVSMST